ncbi:MAG: hypothetical protein QOG62_2816 [Thermoleophilaceae bacterium]|jgi:hypothetical protein|nr:hypothetical protein [Thermoleophilaceae bacterium]
MGMGRRSASPLQYVLLIGGLLAWIGVTVAFAVQINDPAEQETVPRVFAIGGALYFGALFAHVALSASGRMRKTDLDLYRRLALREVTEAEISRTRALGGRVVRVYAGLGALTTGLGLAAIFFSSAGSISSWLIWAAVAVVVLWAALVPWAIRTSLLAGRELLAGLGVAVAGLPDWFPKPGGGLTLVGSVRYVGERRGHEVAMAHGTKVAVTALQAPAPVRHVDDPDALVAIAGGLARDWRAVELDAGPEGVSVVRRANGAGAWMLQDLWLAECAASGVPNLSA